MEIRLQISINGQSFVMSLQCSQSTAFAVLAAPVIILRFAVGKLVHCIKSAPCSYADNNSRLDDSRAGLNLFVAIFDSRRDAEQQAALDAEAREEAARRRQQLSKAWRSVVCCC